MSNLLKTFVLAVILLLVCLSCRAGFAEGPSTTGAKSSTEPLLFVETTPEKLPTTHKFWDKKNVALFVATAAFSAADFAVTRANLQNGGKELNPMVRVFGKSPSALALNFGGQTAGVIGLSYSFHKTGHHKLERLSSFLNIGGSGSAAIYGLAHR